MKVHLISNSLYINSGFGKVTRYIATGLKKLGHEVSMTGLQTSGLVQYYYDIECLPIDSGGHIDETTQVMFNIQKMQPDVVIYVGQLDADLNHLAKLFPKTICYSPVEGKEIPAQMTNDMLTVEKNGGLMVAQCHYGQEEMKKVGVNAEFIYHGYDPEIFYKMDSFEPYCYYETSVGKINTDPVVLCKQGCYHCHRPQQHAVNGQPITNTECPYYKEEMVSILRWMDNNSGNRRWTQRDIGISKLNEEFKGKFVFMFVGQNFGLRKRIERLLKAYAILISESKQLKDRTHLHLHSLPMSIRGINLIKVISDLRIKNNVSFSYGTFRSSGWSEECLNVLYNLADCNVSASSSEGFGLPTLESMACGVPNIGPNCSSFTELIGDGEQGEKDARGLLALIESWQMVQDGSIRALVDQEHLAVMMKKMYVEKEHRERFAKNGIEWAKNHTWEKKVEEWGKLLKII